jgi:FdhE protein
MEDRDEELARLKLNLQEAAEKNPHSKPILEAFGPLMTEQRRLLGSLDWRKIDPAGIDPDRLKAGVPVIRQVPLFFPEDPWEEVLLPLVAAARAGFPDLREAMDAWERCLACGSLPFHDHFRSWPDASLPATWNGLRDVPAGAIRLILASAARIALEFRSAEAAPVLREAGWEKGYCPLCGSPAGIARIHDKVTQRWLHCLRCGWDWRFERVRCPHCDHESPEEMNYIFLDGKTHESAFTCEACKRYIVTLYRISDLGSPDLDVAALSLVHLDLVLQEKGYLPPDPSGWSLLE